MRVQFCALLVMPANVARAVETELTNRPYFRTDYPDGMRRDRKVVAASDADMLRALAGARKAADDQGTPGLRADVARVQDEFLRSAVGAR